MGMLLSSKLHLVSFTERELLFLAAATDRLATDLRDTERPQTASVYLDLRRKIEKRLERVELERRNV